MREFTRDHRLQARSLPEIVEGMEGLVSRFGTGLNIRVGRRKLSAEAVINAAVLHFIRLPADQQERDMRSALARLEAFLNDDAAQATPPPSAPAEPPQPAVSRGQMVEGRKAPERRKKRA